MNIWKRRRRPVSAAPFARESPATRQKRTRETVEFWVKVISPIVTTLAVIVSLYQAHLATATTNALLKNSLRERIAEDRKDQDRLKRLTAEVLREIEKIPNSPWLRADANESQFVQGKKDLEAIIKNLTQKIDGQKFGLSDPWYWAMLSLFEDSFAMEMQLDIAANNDGLDIASNNIGVERSNLAKRKSALTASIKENTISLKESIEDLSRSLDARLIKEIFELND